MRYLATFVSHFAALSCYKACQRQGWPAELGPVPRFLSSSCGTCAWYEGEEGSIYPGPIGEEVEQILLETAPGGPYRLVYQQKEEG